MSEQHLSREAIERYVSRRGPVDEILAAAEHLDVCFDCRDVAAAMVDDGSGEIPHVRERKSLVRSQTTRTMLPWIAGGVVLLIVIALLLLLQK